MGSTTPLSSSMHHPQPAAMLLPCIHRPRTIPPSHTRRHLTDSSPAAWYPRSQADGRSTAAPAARQQHAGRRHKLVQPARSTPGPGQHSTARQRHYSSGSSRGARQGSSGQEHHGRRQARGSEASSEADAGHQHSAPRPQQLGHGHGGASEGAVGECRMWAKLWLTHDDLMAGACLSHLRVPCSEQSSPEWRGSGVVERCSSCVLQMRQCNTSCVSLA